MLEAAAAFWGDQSRAAIAGKIHELSRGGVGTSYGTKSVLIVSKLATLLEGECERIEEYSVFEAPDDGAVVPVFYPSFSTTLARVTVLGEGEEGNVRVRFEARPRQRALSPRPLLHTCLSGRAAPSSRSGATPYSKGRCSTPSAPPRRQPATRGGVA